jgi:hypothetical protein
LRRRAGWQSALEEHVREYHLPVDGEAKAGEADAATLLKSRSRSSILI